jgi:hypothetical protein
MGVYKLGEPVGSICLKSGRLCIVQDNVVRPLVKRWIYQNESNHMHYPVYSPLGTREKAFIDVDPDGSHDIRRFVPHFYFFKAPSDSRYI